MMFRNIAVAFIRNNNNTIITSTNAMNSTSSSRRLLLSLTQHNDYSVLRNTKNIINSMMMDNNTSGSRCILTRTNSSSSHGTSLNRNNNSSSYDGTKIPERITTSTKRISLSMPLTFLSSRFNITTNTRRNMMMINNQTDHYCFKSMRTLTTTISNMKRNVLNIRYNDTITNYLNNMNYPLINSVSKRYKHGMKTNSSIRKRIRVRGNNTLVRSRSGAQHNTGYKSRNKSNHLTRSTTISNPKVEKKMKRVMGIS